MTTLKISRTLRTTANRLRLIVVGTLAIVGLISTGSSANAIVYNPLTVNINLPLSDGGTLSGFFTLDTQYGGISDYSLTTTGGVLPPETYFHVAGFPPPAAEASPFGAPTTLDFFPNNWDPLLSYAAVLELKFTGNLLFGGVALETGGPSWECINSFVCPSPGNLPNFGVRYVEGTLGVPEPSTLFLLASGLGLLGFLSRRKRATCSAA
jgi:hypothetical protein